MESPRVRADCKDAINAGSVIYQRQSRSNRQGAFRICQIG